MTGRRVLLTCAAVAALVGACAGAGPLEPPAPYEAAEPAGVASPDDRPRPTGEVVAAYPEEPSTWYPPLTAEVAAEDLAHLWGLPLFHIDEHGLLRHALAVDADPALVDGVFVVDVTLAAGTWSDGTPVTADDVRATVEALLSDTRTAPALAPLTGAEVLGAHAVRLLFDAPTGRWAYVLAAGTSVLPAHVLEQGGLEAFRGVPPVTGGPFRVETYERGRRVRFETHADSPLGGPRLQVLEVAFVPEVDTAFGLLRDGRAQIALGYLALNPVERAQQVDGVTATAPLGGTAVSLRWRAEGALGGESQAARRRAVRDAIDVEPQVEGLFGGIAEVARSVLPGQPGPWGRDAPSPDLRGVSPSIVVPRWQEAPAFTARSLQRDLRTYGGGAELIRLDPDVVAGSSRGDAVLEVRRLLPWPSATGMLSSGDTDVLRDLAREADRASTRRDEHVVRFVGRAFEEGHVLPLYRIGVTHAWAPALGGVNASSWPGIGFVGASSWHLVEGSQDP